ncbi:hypothetical protein [Absidia glauca]|uniref:Peptidase S9 prolyl oligopeptidase catalytic domain-containing protein n=1 Tax=Absidia glauca TaxID=4829 RepID=A0A168SNP3_ABSGL|nr:hypothetical protein [Absidia glauca]
MHQQGAPHEFGLELDARAAYDWLTSKKGTGVATTLAHSLSKAGTPPHALILQAAFTSVGKVLFEYRLFETFPPFWLYSKLGVNEETVISRFRQKFNSLSRIADVKCPILIVVGSNDFEIPPIHSKQLFFAALGKDPLALTDNIEKEAGIQVRQVQHEATVYTQSSSSLVQLVILLDANHNNCEFQI